MRERETFIERGNHEDAIGILCREEEREREKVIIVVPHSKFYHLDMCVVK
jgi:hypothetical protein